MDRVKTQQEVERIDSKVAEIMDVRGPVTEEEQRVNDNDLKRLLELRVLLRGIQSEVP